jgi:putative membrane protein
VVIAGLVLISAAAALHVWIFVLESLAWTSPRARATFGLTREQAEATRQMAFNQGFYNLFLALAAAAGVVVLSSGGPTGVAVALALTGAGSMVAAALVLALSDRSKLRAAVAQGAFPLLGAIALAVGLATR